MFSVYTTEDMSITGWLGAILILVSACISEIKKDRG